MLAELPNETLTERLADAGLHLSQPQIDRFRDALPQLDRFRTELARAVPPRHDAPAAVFRPIARG